MQKSAKNYSTKNRVLASGSVAAAAVILVLLAGCSGSHPNNQTPTALNPAPGVMLERISITPSTPIMLLTESRQLYATGIYSDGSSVDISSSVTWSSSPVLIPPQTSAPDYVTINSSGVATASGMGQATITATVGPVIGVLGVTVASDGFSSSTMAILAAPYKNTEIDVAYMPQQTKILGGYAVQELNLDADEFSSVLPPAVTLMASIPMPAGFVPDAAAASQTSGQVAVISYNSPDIQIIDASNNPLDTANNTIIATYTAPVTQSVTLNGIPCMICAAVVNPLNNLLILSTAEGFYSMNLTSGAFTAIPFAPAPAPSANITVDPLGTPDPFIVSAVPSSGETQILDLNTYSVATYAGFSPAPATSTVDLSSQYAWISDGNTNDQTLVNFNPSAANPTITPQTNVGICPGTNYFNMVALEVTQNGGGDNLITSQTGGNCIGVEAFSVVGGTLSFFQVPYGYGSIPNTPTDPNNPNGCPFMNGSDPNAISAFVSVYGSHSSYGVLVHSNSQCEPQQWIAKVNFNSLSGFLSAGLFPTGTNLTPPGGTSEITADGQVNYSVVFLPTPSTTFTLSTASIAFGTVSVGTSSPQSIVTLANVGASTLSPQISLGGANPGAFSVGSNCATALLPLSSCPIYVTFTPTAAGASSASITVSSSGLPTQTVPLTGTGQ